MRLAVDGVVGATGRRPRGGCGASPGLEHTGSAPPSPLASARHDLR